MKEFIPKRTGTLSKQVTMGLFIISLAAMFASGLPNLPYRSVMQTLSLIVLAAAIALLGRYEFKTYVYALSKREDGTLDLTVTELKRRSRITVCRVGIDKITDACVMTKKDKPKFKEMKRKRKYYNYCVDLAPAKSLCFIANEGGEEVLIILSYIPELSELIGAEERN